MKRIIAIALAVAMVLTLSLGVALAKPEKACTTIQDGVLTYSAGSYLEGEVIPLGYDDYGYNYQAHMFNGYYANVYLNGDGYPVYEPENEEQYVTDNPDVVDAWYWPYRNCELIMKWNDAWLSNKDCDKDLSLDRHCGYNSYIGSGAWCTNHQSGSYLGEDGKMHKWTYFCKIVAVPEDATLKDGTWYTADGTEIGPSIWGAFATIQEVESGVGATYVSPAGPGFGKW